MVALTADALDDHQEWPVLNNNTSTTTRRQDEWELLEQEEEEFDTSPTNDCELKEEDSFEVIIESDAIPNAATTSHRHLRHCNSSPNLSAPAEGSFCQTPPTNSESILLTSVLEDEEESSFAMVSGPSSVWTSPTTLNFRDAILASPTSDELDSHYLPSSSSSSSPFVNTAAVSSSASPARNKNKTCGLRKFQPRFVVVPTLTQMQRCTRSTGDLPSLVLHDDNDNDDNNDESEDAWACRRSR
jgi:hypothetical protein